ncbi:phosphoadenylyl-sulfate reductase [Roseibacterium sp. SDUM158017]|uniref:phosphoadenylyl-sulfate reductase n=1 Tax=Roseicyclus salinarum TaxID=3036773 RepID=UPI00241542EE|nr:phosphoadenylyl-sulfate reductase [Roseibacterium sp. SDUM158017]MDG4650052.1 phosphoadenylyl-sulfate reductase [Roseibacterium sp. SDUM158017]
MRHDAILPAPAQRAARLNAETDGLSTRDLLERVLDGAAGRAALVSSFGAEAVVLLHMAARIDPSVPVLFVETGMLFPETLAYQREVAERLGLSDLRLIRPAPDALGQADPDGTLHGRDADACCALRKTEPLTRALAPFDAWITGRKRFQGAGRAHLERVEAEAGTGRIKVNPLARWSREDVRAYMEAHALPRHPLVARGYASIGCAPCTSPVAPGEDPRAGRWRGLGKEECGIHFVDGVAVRGAQRRAS